MEFQVDARNLEIRKTWQDKIEEEKDRLSRHHSGLIHHLRLSIESTSSHKEGGYEIRLVAMVPNDTVIVKRKGESVRPLIGEAFDVLTLQLKEMLRKKRQGVKGQEAESPSDTGLIKRLYPFESYGFIEIADGREIYFHENALKDLTMDQLAEGDEVRFGAAEGDKGPCAAWVRSAK